MKKELLSTLRGVAELSVAKKLDISQESLQNILNGYPDNEFLNRFNLTEELVISIRNEVGLPGLKGMIVSKLL
jgi:hypothetical protein